MVGMTNARRLQRHLHLTRLRRMNFDLLEGERCVSIGDGRLCVNAHVQNPVNLARNSS